MTRLILSVLFVVALAACETKKTEPAPPAATKAATEVAPTETATAVAAPAADKDHVHSVSCGCSLGKECSNMIEVDGKYVPLTGDVGLDKMAFCGKKDLQAKVEGDLAKDGAFVATSFELIE